VRAIQSEAAASRSSGREGTPAAVGTPAEALYCALLRASSIAQLENAVAKELPTLLSALSCKLYWPGGAEDAQSEGEYPPAVRQALTRGAEVSVAESPDGVMQVAMPLRTRPDAVPRAILCCDFAAKTPSRNGRLARIEAAGRQITSRLEAVLEVEMLQRSVTRLEQAERLQRALYAIADQANSDREMPDVLRAMHEIVGSLMYAENFYLVLYDRSNDSIRFAYFVDIADTDTPSGTSSPMSEMRGSLTWHLIRRGRALMGTPTELEKHIGEPLAAFGPECVDWLGVPLVRGSEVVGGIVVQSYTESARFGEEDRALLAYVAQHILTALEHKQTLTDLERHVAERTEALREANLVLQQQVIERQRGEHLQAALFRIAELANTTDSLDEFYEAVHRVVGSLLYARNFYIALLADNAHELLFPYSVDEFDPLREARELGKGLTEYVLRTGTALLADRDDIGRLQKTGEVVSYGTLSSCWLGVPLICVERTVGVLAVQSYADDHRYTLRDQELLTFVSYHIANALERKRHAESLKHAYAELEQRVAERTAELAAANRELRGEIERRERIERQLKHETLHDALTGLPNRALLLDRLASALTHYTRDPRRLFAVLFLDLDRFKIINDSVGHLLGDELLEEVGRRIADSLEPRDLVARLGGDEFAVLLSDIENDEDATASAQRLIDVLNAPIRLANKEVFTSASIGIAVVAPRYRKAEDLLRDADVAMYRAKAEGRHRFALFDETLHRDALHLLELEGDLRRAVSRQEFEPFFQPIQRLDDATVVGYEALLRWRHPQRGLLMPDSFLTVAEESGISEQIDWLIFERVCQVAGALTASAQTGSGFVGINLSGRHFHSADLAGRLLDLFDTHKVAPNAIRVEVTEHVLLDNPALVKRTLQKLRTAGVTIALDDFGTGYSSLSYLHQFPLQALKIDRSFVAELTSSSSTGSNAVVRAILALAGSLGMQVIAEGIETEMQREQLIRLGCEIGQGFLFGAPEPAAHWLGATV
jgi:diguanylate cyclase (GGDEF)-like protein